MSFQTHSSWYSRERALKTDTEEKKLLNKVIIFVFFAHKKYSCSFIKLRLNHWCHMNYFNDDLTNFLGLECSSYIAVYAESESSWISFKKDLNFCSEDERRSYGFGTTWSWLINDRIFIFGRTIPLWVPKQQLSFECQNKTDITWKQRPRFAYKLCFSTNSITLEYLSQECVT